MSNYLCLKSCRFSGIAYNPGDTIPEAIVLPQRVGALVRLRVIGVIAADAVTREEAPPSSKSAANKGGKRKGDA